MKPKLAVKNKTTNFVVPAEANKAITDYFGAKVEVKVAGNGKGKISIPFHSEEDFNRIIKLIKG